MMPPCGTHTRPMSPYAKQANNIIDSTLMEQLLAPISDTQSAVVPDIASPIGNASGVDQPKDNLFLITREDPNFDTMPYPYPR